MFIEITSIFVLGRFSCVLLRSSALRKRKYFVLAPLSKTLFVTVPFALVNSSEFSECPEVGSQAGDF